MNRKIGFERLYTLGNYKNLKVTDEISDLPYEVWKSVPLLRELQFIQTDLVYMNYVKESRVMNNPLNKPEEIEELIHLLDESRTSTLEKLKEAFAEQTLTETTQAVITETINEESEE